MATDQDARESGGDNTFILWTAAAAAAFLIAVPATIGGCIWMACRRYGVAKREWAVLGVGGLLAILIGGLAAPYAQWLAVLVTGKGNRLAVPWLAIVAISSVCASVAGLVEGTAITGRLPFKTKKDPFARDQIIPDAGTRAQAKVAKVPGGTLTPHASSHSIMSPTDPGKRTFPLGVDQRGVPVELSEDEIRMHALLFGSTGSGKALALDTPIPTPTGWTTMGELEVGDQVFDETGSVSQVVFATETQFDHDCYEVVFSDGSTIVADADHRWVTQTWRSRVSRANADKFDHKRLRRPRDNRLQRHKRQHPEVRTTRQLLETLNGPDGRANHSIPLALALDLEEIELPVSPYVLGVRLGDGSSSAASTCADPEILQATRHYGYKVRQSPSGPYSYSVTGRARQLRQIGVLTPKAQDRKTRELRGSTCDGPAGKHIPALYLRASADQRLELLQGLMDTGGTVGRSGACEFSTPLPDLADDVRELLVSLGIQSRLKVRASYLHGGRKRDRYRISFTTDKQVFKRKRKAHRLPSSTRSTHRYITNVRPVPSVPVRCIQVDTPSHLYLAGHSMIPTHNTETIKAIAGGLLDLGWDGLILDLKEDTTTDGLLDWCEIYAAHHALPFQELCLSDPAPTRWFNPLAGLGPDEARDAILSLQEFDAPYYKAINQKQLGQLTNLLYWAHEADPTQFEYPNPLQMGRILSKSSLPSAVKKYAAVVTTQIPGVEQDDFHVLLKPSKAEADAAPGLGARITSMYDTQAGRTVLRPAEGRSELDVTQSGLTYVGLDSQGKPDLTKMISSAMLQRLSAYAAQRTTGRTGHDKAKPRFLIVDEANWVDRIIIQNLLSRARGAGITMILATQGPRDWIDARGDDFAKLGQNTNVAIIMSQGEPTSAEICADYIGKEEYYQVTNKIEDGVIYAAGSVRSDLTHRVTPDQLRSLEIGEAVLRVGKPTEKVTWLSIRVRDPKEHARRA